MQGIRSLITNILNADKLGKQAEACKHLEDGVEKYADQKIIKELEELASTGKTLEEIGASLYYRIKSLKLKQK